VGGGRQMGKMDERPTQRHMVTGDVSEDRTRHSTGRLDEGEEDESEVTREARVGREGGENEVEETRRQEAAEEKVEAAGEMERIGEKRKLTKRGKINKNSFMSSWTGPAVW